MSRFSRRAVARNCRGRFFSRSGLSPVLYSRSFAVLRHRRPSLMTALLSSSGGTPCPVKIQKASYGIL